MIVAGHAANEGLTTLVADLPSVEGVDLASTVDRVSGWGGDPRLYTHFLAGAVAASTQLDPAAARQLGVVAAWRSGVLGLRAEALSAAAVADPAGAAAALGIAESELTAFVAAQALDRFAHPESAELVARVGGFRGFGGPWVAAPTSARFVGDGVVEVYCGTEVWSIALDVFCARLERVDEAAEAIDTAIARAETSTESYLVSIVRLESA